ncbi:amidohydrolase family protein [Candidatus Moduliflexota bacterium]
MIITADRLFPVSSPPVDNGALLIGKGVILDVGDGPSLRRTYPNVVVRDYPGCVILPGLVNAHTHLEYSDFHRLARPTSFLPWMRKLIRASLLRRWFGGALSWRRSAGEGIRASLAAGITSVGDIVTFGGGLAAAASAGIRTRAFLEAVAIRPEDAGKSVERIRASLEKECWNSLLHPGISPHSVYTVAPGALSALGELASEFSLPLAVHAGETAHEIDLLRGRGPLAMQIDRFGLPFGRDFRQSLLSYLHSRGILTARSLLVHGAHLKEEDLELTARSGATLVTCPRSNILLGTGLPDYALWKRCGISFVYGTDSLASVPGFDLFEEARQVLGILPEEARTVLRRLTLGGARALGLDRQTGSLEAGKAADLAILRMEDAGSCDADDIVGKGSARRISATWVGGDLLYSADLTGRAPSPPMASEKGLSLTGIALSTAVTRYPYSTPLSRSPSK